MLGRLAIKFCLENNVLHRNCELQVQKGTGCTYIDSVTALFSDIGDRTKPTGTEHDLVVVNEGVLVHAPEDVTSRYVVPDLGR